MEKTLKERRLALGLRLRDLAEQSGVSYGSCWNYEHGKADHAIVNKDKAVIDYLDNLEKERAKTKEVDPC